MDSGNSGSLQSSSGGGADDELDSSTSSPLAALLRQQGFGGGGGGSPLIYGLQDLATPPVSSHWCSTTAARLPPAAGGGASASSPSPSLPCHGGLQASSASAAEQTATAVTAQPAAAAPPRGSRKRARASRRAPTTVFTTDTSNFRAMVQEFTGIPSPPFPSGAAPSSRYDHLFPSRSSSSCPAAFPQYLLRPFVAHKLHAAYPPPPSTSSPAPANAATAASTAAPAATAVASSDSYEPSALLRMQQDHSGVNSYLSFQSTLAAAHLDGGDAKYPSLFDDHRRVTPTSAAPRMMQDPTGFLHGVVMSSEGTRAHLRPRNGDRGDELLSGLVGVCKTTYSSSSAPPPLERIGRSQPAGVSTATPPPPPPVAMRTQGVESWVCGTSE
ncbi:hypothetical protein HU200_035995 [Digitaria exilis]|uniref:VQ domain-containing protein n=1 Tax=Digitaria exilis TaxID=1010633 RepID=A0A835BMH4_9POAL|nr:hypothetical protein HU200_035995 [Digitaria exilis]CAB3480894.1 unnamed protein product [Digitaria exilis]